MKKTMMKMKLNDRLRLKLKQDGKQKQKHKHRLLRKLNVIRRKKKLIRRGKKKKNCESLRRRRNEKTVNKLKLQRKTSRFSSRWNLNDSRRKKLSDRSFSKTVKMRTSKIRETRRKTDLSEVSLKSKETTMEPWYRKQRSSWQLMMMTSQLRLKETMLALR
jgi:hypothetical protein